VRWSGGAETLAEIRAITGDGTDFALETSAVPAVFRLAVDGLRGLGICILGRRCSRRHGGQLREAVAAARPDRAQRDPG
jgi:hypothetical protein